MSRTTGSRIGRPGGGHAAGAVVWKNMLAASPAAARRKFQHPPLRPESSFIIGESSNRAPPEPAPEPCGAPRPRSAEGREPFVTRL